MSCNNITVISIQRTVKDTEPHVNIKCLFYVIDAVFFGFKNKVFKVKIR